MWCCMVVYYCVYPCNHVQAAKAKMLEGAVHGQAPVANTRARKVSVFDILGGTGTALMLPCWGLCVHTCPMFAHR